MDLNIIDFLKKDKFATFVGVNVIEAEPGHAVTQLEIAENHINGAGVVQGGVIFTLADFAFAVASNSYGFVTVSVNANITYFKPPKGKILTAEANVVSSGRKLCSYNVDIFDDSNDLIARFSVTGYIKSDKI